jgi:regulator of RNase E activity RraA
MEAAARKANRRIKKADTTMGRKTRMAQISRNIPTRNVVIAVGSIAAVEDTGATVVGTATTVRYTGNG